MANQREYFRFTIPLEGSFSLDGRAEQPLQVVNISPGGLLGEVSAPIPAPHRAVVRLRLDGLYLEAEAMCMRADYDPPYRVAFCFLNTGNDFVSQLQSYLFHKAHPDVR
mgnify:CR=1 FL=1